MRTTTSNLLSLINSWKALNKAPISIQLKDEPIVVEPSAKRVRLNYSLQTEPSVVLTTREKEVGELIQQGYLSYKALANQMSISDRTVEVYLKSIREKLGVANKKALVKRLRNAEFIERYHN